MFFVYARREMPFIFCVYVQRLCRIFVLTNGVFAAMQHKSHNNYQHICRRIRLTYRYKFG
jgi:hypothetical protein